MNNGRNPSGHEEAAKIKGVIAEIYGDATVAEMEAKGRGLQHIAWQRQVAMHFCLIAEVGSLNKVGGYFGGRDHGTVMHADKTVREQLEINHLEMKRYVQCRTAIQLALNKVLPRIEDGIDYTAKLLGLLESAETIANLTEADFSKLVLSIGVEKAGEILGKMEVAQKKSIDSFRSAMEKAAAALARHEGHPDDAEG